MISFIFPSLNNSKIIDIQMNILLIREKFSYQTLFEKQSKRHNDEIDKIVKKISTKFPLSELIPMK